MLNVQVKGNKGRWVSEWEWGRKQNKRVMESEWQSLSLHGTRINRFQLWLCVRELNSMCPTVLFSPAPLHFFLTSTALFQIKRKENNLIPLFIKRCFLSFFKLGLFLRRKKIILQRNFIFFILYFNFKKLLYFLYFSKWRRNRGRWNKYVRKEKKKEIDEKYRENRSCLVEGKNI